MIKFTPVSTNYQTTFGKPVTNPSPTPTDNCLKAAETKPQEDCFDCKQSEKINELSRVLQELKAAYQKLKKDHIKFVKNYNWHNHYSSPGGALIEKFSPDDTL